MLLPPSFYTRPDVVQIAQELLGKRLFTNIGGEICAGRIVETEAYSQTEKACHAYNARRTARTEIMFAEGGIAYVYLCYGMYSLFNVVTNQKDRADAVLIRAIEPILNPEIMLFRRKMEKLDYSLSSGPGKLTIALGIGLEQNALSLQGNTIWIEDAGEMIEPSEIISSPRVGVAYAGEDALLDWRFRVKGSTWCSKAK